MALSVRIGSSKTPVVLLVEEEVLIRLSIAEYLRHCGFWVIEAASAHEAKSILLADETVHIVMCDAQLAGDESGFALAQWVRRRRPNMALLLAASVAGKARAAADLCDKHALGDKQCEHPHLADRIQSMMARRARKNRSPRGALRANERLRRG
ncbi:MAG TPA: response regulator [Caulobacterales bacterium]|nr:response regulator [Caulobacterales bacterium]